MLPVLVSLGPLTIYSYGVFLALGFLVGLFVVWKKGREAYFDEESLYDTVLVTALFALVGARFFYLVTHPADFGYNVFSWVNLIGRPGFSHLGAIIGGGCGLWWKTKRSRLDFFAVADALSPGTTVVTIFGWLGAFLNGTAIGVPTTLPWGITFPGLLEKRHPAQIYALLLTIGLFTFLWWSESKYRTFNWYRGNKSSARPGFLTMTYLVGMGLTGLLVSLVTTADQFWFGLPATTWFWGGLTMGGMIGLYRRSGRRFRDDLQSVTSAVSGHRRRGRRQSREIMTA